MFLMFILMNDNNLSLLVLLQGMPLSCLSSSNISACATSPTSSLPTLQHLISVWECFVSSPISCPSTHPTGMLDRLVKYLNSFYTPTGMLDILVKYLTSFYWSFQNVLALDFGHFQFSNTE